MCGTNLPSTTFRGTLQFHFVLAFASTLGCLLYRLNNGINLVLLPTPSAPVVAIQAWVSVGSSDESDKQSGICHAMEHMLFKGTATRGAGMIAADVESAGGEINAWTSQDNTVFHVVMPSRYADVGIDVLSDLLGNPSLDEGDFSREKEVIIEEIRQGRDEPLRRLAQNMFNGAFRGHRYSHPVIGNEESVRSLRAADLRRFRKRWYRGNNISLVVSGDFEVSQMKTAIERGFSGIVKGPAIRRPKPVAASGERSASLETADVGQAQIALAFRLPPIAHAACAAMDVLTIVLGQGESSILSKDLVRGKELCKSAYSYLHALQDYSLVVIGAIAEPGELTKLLPQLGRHLQELRDHEISSTALAKARQTISADAIFQRETAEGAAHSLGSYFSLTGDPDFEQKYLASIATIDAKALRAFAQEYFDPQRLHLTALLPKSKTLSTAEKRDKKARAMLALVDKGMAQAAPKASKKKTKVKQSNKATAIVKHTLKNGMTLLVQRDSSVPIVAARAVWTGGQLFENDTKSGISELLAASITRGCGRLSAAEIIDAVDSRSATLAGFAGRNSFGLRAEWLGQHWQAGFDLLSECLLSPRFDSEEVSRAQRRQLFRIDAQKESPSNRAFALFHRTIFRKHQYRNPLSGSKASVSTLDGAKLQIHYRKHYPISALTLSVVGDVDPKLVIARVEARFAAETAKTRPARLDKKEVFSGRTLASRQVYDTMEREQSQLVIGFPGITISDKERSALEVLTTVLGGQGGRLFTVLRDQQSLAYQLGAFSLEGIDPGYVAIYLSCSPEKIQAAISGVEELIEAVRTTGISQAELKRSKRLLIGTHEISLQRRSSVAAALAFHHAYGLAGNEHLHYAARIQKVRLSEVQAVARRILDWQKAVTVTVGPVHASPAAAERSRGKIQRTRKRRKK